jgi:hypothetical protein
MSTAFNMGGFDEDLHREVAQGLVTGKLEDLSAEALVWGLRMFSEALRLLQEEEQSRTEEEVHWLEQHA